MVIVFSRSKINAYVFNNMTDIFQKDKVKKYILRELYDKPKYVFDYSSDKDDDKILQNIIIMVELLYANYKKNEITNANEEDLFLSLEYLEDKIGYLLDIRESFDMKYDTERLKDISIYLDSLTVQENIQDFMDTFSKKISITLDLLYVVYSKLEFFINNLAVLK